jgi:DNA-binding Xre family transcriptional regulator
MISYAPFYKTLKEKGISTYKLINEHNISRSLLDRPKHNKPITTVTINDLCKILNCRIEDILEYISEKEQGGTLTPLFKI